MSFNTGRVEAIGSDDKPSVKYTSQVEKKYPWENIGGMLNGFGSYMENIPANFNSAFTVGKSGGTKAEGAFLG